MNIRSGVGAVEMNGDRNLPEGWKVYIRGGSVEVKASASGGTSTGYLLTSVEARRLGTEILRAFGQCDGDGSITAQYMDPIRWTVSLTGRNVWLSVSPAEPDGRYVLNDVESGGLAVMLLQASVMVEQLDSDAVDGPGSELLEKGFREIQAGTERHSTEIRCLTDELNNTDPKLLSDPRSGADASEEGGRDDV